MSHIDDIGHGGIIPARHEDPQTPLDVRVLRFACAVERDEDGFFSIVDDSVGPVIGMLALEAAASGVAGKGRQAPAWSFNFPMAALGGENFTPVFGPAWDVYDSDFVQTKLSTPDGNRYPGFWPGLAVAGTDQDEHHNLFVPGFPGLACVARGSEPLHSSWVYDTNQAGELDPDNRAQVHSAWRVYRLPVNSVVNFGGTGLNHGLAWQLGNAIDGVAGLGVVVGGGGGGQSNAQEDTAPVRESSTRANGGGAAGAGNVYGAAASAAGGPLDVGDAGDQHRLGMNRDGEIINSLHLSTSSIFRGGGGDAPLEFGGKYKDADEFAHLAQTYLRYDENVQHGWVGGERKGLWRFETTVPYQIVEANPKRPGGDPIPKSGPGGDPIPKDGPETGKGKKKDGTIPKPLPPFISAPWQQTPINSASNPSRKYVASSNEWAFPGVLLRPQHLSAGATDLRNDMSREAAEDHARNVQQETPVVARLEAWGAQSGSGWTYTDQPGNGRYVSGTAAGGVVLLPPELGMENFGSTLPSSVAYFVTLPGLSYLAHGTPDTATGGVLSGFRLGATTSDIWRLDDLGATGAVNATVPITVTKSTSRVTMGYGLTVAGITSTGDITIDKLLPALILDDDTGDDWHVRNNAGVLEIYNATDAAASMAVDGDGRIGVGIAAGMTNAMHIYKSSTSGVFLRVENTSASGAAARAGVLAVSDTGSVNFVAHASSSTTSRYGVTVAGYGEINSFTGSGLLIGTTIATPLIIGTNATARLHLTSDGYFGVGQASPVVSLDILHATPQLRIQGTGTTSELRINSAYGGADLGAIGTVGASPFMLFTNNTQQVTVLSSGLVGINTTGPDRRLDILDASNPQLRLTYTDGTVYSDFQTNSAGILIVTPTGGSIQAPNGGTSNPAYAFANDADVGMYYAASTLLFAVAGVDKFWADATTFTVDEDFAHTGTNAGLYSVTPVPRNTGWTVAAHTVDKSVPTDDGSLTSTEATRLIAEIAQALLDIGILGA